MSIKEIKNITGYSYSTISRVLSGKAAEFRISRSTCQKILDAAEKLNYRPNILARSLRLRKTMTIGLIVSDIQNPFFGELASLIEGLLRRHGYSTILCNTNEVPENEEFYLKVLMDRQVDGIIITPIHTAEWPYMESLGKETPVVLIDRIFYETDLPWVTSENTAAAERVTHEFISLGYKRIAFLGGPPETYITNARYKGYAKAMTERFGGVDESLVLFQGYSAKDGEEVLERLFERRSDTEAVFCVNNLVFFGAAKIANRLEIRQGRPLMMAGFDIGEYSNLFKWPLISADQNLAELARGAVRLLLPRVSDAEIKDTHLVVPISVNKYRLLDFSY
jgi:LacI family transcriptional regulator